MRAPTMGARQRIVALGLKARMHAQSQAAQTAGLDAELRSPEIHLNGVLEELRTIASGLHPAALSRGGLAPALRTLARRSPVPVVLDARLSEGPLGRPLGECSPELGVAVRRGDLS